MKKRRKILVVLLAILIPVSIGFGYKFFSWKGNKSLSNQAMTVDGDISIKNILNGVILCLNWQTVTVDL